MGATENHRFKNPGKAAETEVLALTSFKRRHRQGGELARLGAEFNGRGGDAPSLRRHGQGAFKVGGVSIREELIDKARNMTVGCQVDRGFAIGNRLAIGIPQDQVSVTTSPVELMATPVRKPVDVLRTGEIKPSRGALVPTPAIPDAGKAKRSTPPTTPSASVARAEPTTNGPCPLVVKTAPPCGGMSKGTLAAGDPPLTEMVKLFPSSSKKTRFPVARSVNEGFSKKMEETKPLPFPNWGKCWVPAGN